VFRTADRVYLITEGGVVTKGTPHELLNDEVAIKAYLGRSFEEDGFTRHFATRVSRNASEVLGGESTHPSPPRATATLFHSEAHLATTDTPAPVGTLSGSLGGTTSAILELERLRQTVEKLAHDHTLRTAMLELVGHGESSIPILLEALERREQILRRRAFEVLKVVAKADGPLDFDADAPPDVRLRQVAYLRAKLERKR
jgi:lipopolysaccharide export system ATP-binding protein